MSRPRKKWTVKIIMLNAFTKKVFLLFPMKPSNKHVYLTLWLTLTASFSFLQFLLNPVHLTVTTPSIAWWVVPYTTRAGNLFLFHYVTLGHFLLPCIGLGFHPVFSSFAGTTDFMLINIRDFFGYFKILWHKYIYANGRHVWFKISLFRHIFSRWNPLYI